VAAVIVGWLGGFSHFRLTLAISFIYSNCIGTLLGLGLPLLDVRLRGRSRPFRWWVTMAAVVGLTAVGCALAGVAFAAFELFPTDQFWVYYWSSSRFALLLCLVLGLVSLLYEELRAQLRASSLELKTKELEKERALKQAAEARLSSLESRVHPHFLFNTLNSIAALVREDPARAEQTIERLASLLRASLDASRGGLAELEQELRIVQDYLEIEKARFGDRLRYSIHIPAELEGVRVPALGLQTLVENSVKYAVAPRREGGEIRLSATLEDGSVRLEVWDDGPGFLPDQVRTGHGLDNLQGRLATLFGERGALKILRRDGGTLAVIEAPR